MQGSTPAPFRREPLRLCLDSPPLVALADGGLQCKNLLQLRSKKNRYGSQWAEEGNKKRSAPAPGEPLQWRFASAWDSRSHLEIYNARRILLGSGSILKRAALALPWLPSSPALPSAMLRLHPGSILERAALAPFWLKNILPTQSSSSLSEMHLMLSNSTSFLPSWAPDHERESLLSPALAPASCSPSPLIVPPIFFPL